MLSFACRHIKILAVLLSKLRLIGQCCDVITIISFSRVGDRKNGNKICVNGAAIYTIIVVACL